MLNRSKDLILAALVIAASLLLSSNASNSTIRILFAIPLVFIVPGYLFLEAFMGSGRLDPVERWAMVLGISLGLTMLGGFFLNLTSQGLQYSSWALLLGGLSFFFFLIAFARRLASLRQNSEQASVQGSLKLEPLTILFVTASLFIVTWTVSFAQSGVASSSSSFTQFWMLPASSSATVSTPLPQTTTTPAPTAQAQDFKIGITNVEKEPANYSVVVKVGNQVIKQWQGIQLQPGQSWQDSFPYTPRPNQTTPVQAFLYQSVDLTQVYRTVTWSPVTK